MCRKNIHHSSAYFVKFLNPLSHNIFFLAETFNSLDSVSFPHSKIISFLFKFQLRTEHFQWFTARSSYSHDAIATIHIQTTSRKGRRFDFHLNSFFFFRLHLIPFHVFFEAARLCNSLRFIFLFLIILLWNKKHTKKQRGGKKMCPEEMKLYVVGFSVGNRWRLLHYCRVNFLFPSFVKSFSTFLFILELTQRVIREEDERWDENRNSQQYAGGTTWNYKEFLHFSR